MLCQLTNDAIYEKAIENLRNRINVKLVNHGGGGGGGGDKLCVA